MAGTPNFTEAELLRLRMACSTLDVENVVHSLTRISWRDVYTSLTTADDAQSLEILVRDTVVVIQSDQCIPRINYSGFLLHAGKENYDSILLIFSIYSILESVTDAINRGAIYKFLTKPLDDDLLREDLRQVSDQDEKFRRQQHHPYAPQGREPLRQRLCHRLIHPGGEHARDRHRAQCGSRLRPRHHPDPYHPCCPLFARRNGAHIQPRPPVRGSGKLGILEVYRWDLLSRGPQLVHRKADAFRRARPVDERVLGLMAGLVSAVGRCQFGGHI